MNIISVETLRTWLEEHRDVVVLDVRTTRDAGPTCLSPS